jgi:cbb3-type cytochrome oxidase subunit 3
MYTYLLKKMSSKKSQIQMMETISVLLIFFVIVFLGLVFYMNYNERQAKKMAEEAEELKRTQVVQIASSLPELQCAEKNILKSACIDLFKLEAFASGDIGKDYYFDYFFYSNVTVMKIFPSPEPGEQKKWQLYFKDLPKRKNKMTTYLPILISDPIKDQRYFGAIVVEVYT